MRLPYFEKGLLIDQTELVKQAAKDLVNELRTKQWQQIPLIPAEAFCGGEALLEEDEISEFRIFCNAFCV